MQALGLGVASVMGVGGGKYLYGSEKQANRSVSSSGGQHPYITVATQHNSGMGLSHLLFAGALGAAAVMVLGGFQWLRRDDAAKRLQPHIKRLENSALKQVRKADENSADRDQRLDRNTKIRMLNMQKEIVGENRGNFEMLSQQVHCLTQVALQTLTTLAKPTTTAGGEGMEEAAEREQQKLLEWTRTAQVEADKFVDQKQISRARNYHISSLRAEIPGLTSPGGGEVKEEELISIGPHKLVDRTQNPKTKKERQYMTTGLVGVGSIAILYSVYFMFVSGTSNQSH
jgi:hypothetical protein